MTKTIFKYQIEVTDFQRIEMPKGAEILCVQTQGGTPCIWALVEPDAPPAKIAIETFGTGHIVPEAQRRYIGTYQLDGGALVFHCFELVSLV